MAQDFNQTEFWIKRHSEYKDDPRSVGNAAASRAENLNGEKDLQAAVSSLARRFSRMGLVDVLDLGCGYGRVAGSFISNRMTYTGVDVSQDALDLAKKRNPKGRFIQGDLRNVEIKNKYDIVSILYVLVHFVDDSEWEDLIRRACSSLRPGGRLVFADYFPPERSSPVAHVVSRPIEDYIKIFDDIGFEMDVEMINDFSKQPYTCVPAFRFAKKS